MRFYALALQNPEPLPILLALCEDWEAFLFIYLVLSFCVAANYYTQKFCKKQPKSNIFCTSLLYLVTLILVAMSHVFFGRFEVHIFGDFLDLYKGTALLIYLRELKAFLNCLLRLGLHVGSLRHLAIKLEQAIIARTESFIDKIKEKK
jgi:uncharacterized membrane protein